MKRTTSIKETKYRNELNRKILYINRRIVFVFSFTILYTVHPQTGICEDCFNFIFFAMSSAYEPNESVKQPITTAFLNFRWNANGQHLRWSELWTKQQRLQRNFVELFSRCWISCRQNITSLTWMILIDYVSVPEHPSRPFRHAKWELVMNLLFCWWQNKWIQHEMGLAGVFIRFLGWIYHRKTKIIPKWNKLIRKGSDPVRESILIV